MSAGLGCANGTLVPLGLRPPSFHARSPRRHPQPHLYLSERPWAEKVLSGQALASQNQVKGLLSFQESWHFRLVCHVGRKGIAHLE